MNKHEDSDKRLFSVSSVVMDSSHCDGALIHTVSVFERPVKSTRRGEIGFSKLWLVELKDIPLQGSSGMCRCQAVLEWVLQSVASRSSWSYMIQ